MKILKLFSVILLLSLSGAASAQTTFAYTGTIQSWTVPAGAATIAVTVNAAAGGNTYYSSGGCGGTVTCHIAVTPGQVLNIFVGNQGGDATLYGPGAGGNTGPTALTGGDGGNSPYTGGAAGGGGSSDIRIGGIALTDRVVVAGGGGGAGNDFCGSELGGVGGGALAAGDGENCGGYIASTCGAGATPSVAGAGASAGGASGASLFGGDGTSLVTTYYGYYGYYYYYSTAAGGGGGAGYFGGGGGNAGGGGGGSSYVSPTLTSSVTHAAGASCGDGSVIIDVLCTTPVGGAIVGSSTPCVGSTITYTNPTGTAGGTWSSSATSVFTVNPTTGTVTALATGSGTLTYSITLPCGSASATLPLTVVSTASPITGDSVICSGGSDTLYNTVPGGVWTSATPSVGTIDPTTGIYSAIGPGTTLISYTLGSCSVTTVLTVNTTPSAITGPTLVCHTSTMTLSSSPAGGTWSSNTPLGASVDPLTGVVTGVSVGATAYIYYTLPTGCAVLRLVSVNTVPSAITGPTDVCQGNAIGLTQSVPGGAWTSSNPAVAIVTTTPSTFFPGYVTGLTPGVVTISYTKASCPPATYVVTINPGPAAITGPTTICTGMTTLLSSASTGGFWSSTNPAIIINPATGAVTSSTIGAVGTIYYTFPTGCYASVPVNVSYGAPPMVGPATLCKDATDTFFNSDPAGIWSSTDLSIAQIIDSSGVATGISAGTVNISYTLPNGCFSVQPLTINPRIAGVVSVTRYPSGIICEDDTVLIVATPVVGGGSAPTFNWKKFSVTIPGETNDTLVYIASWDSLHFHGDVINCFMFPNDGCPLYDSVADSAYMDVAPLNVHPKITITTSGPDTVAFLGQSVTFYSSVTWGGPSPTYQWFRNRVAIPGANAPTYTTMLYGRDTFHCEVIGNPPCMDATLPLGLGISNSIIIHNYLGADALSAGNNSLSLFPNPNNGTFTLSGKLAVISNEDVNYEVANMLGQVVHTGQTTPKNGDVNAHIKTEGLTPGTYLLRVNTGSGSETFHFVIGK